MATGKRPVRTHRNLGRFLVDSEPGIWFGIEAVLAWLLFSFFASFGRNTTLEDVQALLQRGAVFYAICFALLALGLGLFERENRFSRMKSLQLIVAANFLAVPLTLFLVYLLTFDRVGRWSLFLGGVGSCLTIYFLVHFVGSLVLKSHPHRFVFIGEISDLGKRLAAMLKRDNTPQIQHAEDVTKFLSTSLVHKSVNYDALVHQLREESVSVVVFSWQSKGDARHSEFLLAAIRQGLRVVEDAQYYLETTRRVPVKDLSDNYVLKMGFDIHRPIHGFAKRVLDIVGSLMLLLPLLPIFILIALVIRLESRGPAFFFQKRVGRFGQEFWLVKFRTMTKADGDATYYTTKNDNRVTRVGKILRILHFDELPQLWNILAGHMSAVGPRPLATQMVDDALPSLPLYNLRHIVRPGLTGLAQIFQGQTSSDTEEMSEKLSYDLYYVKNFNFFLDLWILSRTVFRLMSSTW